VFKIPFKTFIEWAFDGSLETEIPKPEIDSGGNVIVPDILKPSGPLNQRYVMQMFMKNPKMCLFLNKYFNNINVWYLDKETFFKFIKRCIHDFKFRRSDLLFLKSAKTNKEALVEKLEERFPLLKFDDVRLLYELIEVSPQKDSVYHSFGLKRITTRKVKKEKKKASEVKTSLKSFLKQNFEIVES
jgi:hypothetical protein